MQDSITKSIDIVASIEDVWHALTDHVEFGNWFQIQLDSAFEVGQVTHGILTFPGWEGVPVWFKTIIKDAPHTFSFRWPYAEDIDPREAENANLTTLVELTLEEISSGTRLTVLETGFESLPEDKRAQAFRDNTSGWETQTQNICDYVQERASA
jgi:uncharacterized protein YndB with AHSA1/START domain